MLCTVVFFFSRWTSKVCKKLFTTSNYYYLESLLLDLFHSLNLHHIPKNSEKKMLSHLVFFHQFLNLQKTPSCLKKSQEWMHLCWILCAFVEEWAWLCLVNFFQMLILSTGHLKHKACRTFTWKEQSILYLKLVASEYCQVNNALFI